MPGLLDRYLARTGYQSQQNSRLTKPDAENLWKPADAEQDVGSHGAFDDKATSRSFEFWASRHRNLLTAVATGVAGALVFLAARRS